MSTDENNSYSLNSKCLLADLCFFHANTVVGQVDWLFDIAGEYSEGSSTFLRETQEGQQQNQTLRTNSDLSFIGPIPSILQSIS